MKTEIEFVDTIRDENLERQITEELNKIEDRYPWVIHAIVYLKKGKEPHHEGVCELELRMPGNPIFVKEDGEKFKFAITKTFDVMHRQLEKRKKKMYSHQ